MNSKSINIKEFQRNFYKYIREKENLVVTSDNKPVFEIVFEVVTKKPTQESTSEDIKQQNINYLKSKISDIEQYKPIENKTIHNCEACMKFKRITIPAIGNFEIDEGDKIRDCWLCLDHQPKVLV